MTFNMSCKKQLLIVEFFVVCGFAFLFLVPECVLSSFFETLLLKQLSLALARKPLLNNFKQ